MLLHILCLKQKTKPTTHRKEAGGQLYQQGYSLNDYVSSGKHPPIPPHTPEQEENKRH